MTSKAISTTIWSVFDLADSVGGAIVCASNQWVISAISASVRPL